jgi:hypothetical protein
MIEEFNVDLFINYYKKKQVIIETKHISEWTECSIRHIQKWCQKNNIESHRIHGIKHYIWNEKNIRKFGEWFNRKLNKEPKKYYVPVPKKIKPEKIKVEKKVPFITIKNIVDEIDFNPSQKLSYNSTHGYVEIPDYEEKKIIKTKTRYIQRWCKKNNVPFEYHFGRKYYKITTKIKSQILKSFKNLTV